MPEAAAPRDQSKAHYARRSAVARHLPDLCSRVFALRSKAYMGYGFHYGLERQLGSLIATVNDYNTPLSFSTIVVDEVLFESFLRELLRAEFSSRGWNLPGRPSRAS